jgi:hypothetical protein
MNNNVMKKMIRLNRPLALVLAATLAAWSATPTQAESFDLLTEERMQITLIAAKLSSLAYVKNATVYQVGFDAARKNVPTYAHPDYDAIQFYTEEPDQALVARTGGRCYVAFRYVLSCVVICWWTTDYYSLLRSS